MAKKVEAPKKPVEKTTLSKAKSMVVHAAESVAGAVSDAAASAKKHVVTPVAEAVGIADKKSKAKAPAKAAAAKPAKAAPAAGPKAIAATAPKAPPVAAKKTAAGKVMSKNVSPAPKAVPSRGHQTTAKGKK